MDDDTIPTPDPSGAAPVTPITPGPPRIDAVLAAAPGVARIATSTAQRVVEWMVMTTVETTAEATRAAVGGTPLTKVVADAVGTVRDRTDELLGRRPAASATVVELQPKAPTPDDLQARGRALLRRSADVTYEELVHPAYEQIIDQLAPDEARILRLLAEDGPQAAVDVRASGALPTMSELLAPGITMIGNHAGCRYTERVPQYLNNLQRLGLIWFSREALADVSRYQVLEAQPEVVDVLTGTKRAKTVRRSILLTPFGRDFCQLCIPSRTDDQPK